MSRWRFLTLLSLLSFLSLSLALGACGDNTATPAPATTVASTTATSTTVAPTTAVPTSVATTTAATDNSPLELVRKIDLSTKIKAARMAGVDKQGNFYIGDILQNTINKFDPTGKLILQWGKKGSGDGEFDFNRPSGLIVYGGFMTLDLEGNIYVSDTYNYRIQKFDLNGKFLSKWGNKGNGDGQLQAGSALITDSHNNVYVSDVDQDGPNANGRIQKFDPNGKFLSSYQNPGSGDGQFVQGGSTGVDKQDNLYVSDSLNSRILIFDSNLKYLRKIGSPGTGDGQFSAPTRVAFDSKGNIYAGDNGPNGSRIEIFSPAVKFLGQ